MEIGVDVKPYRRQFRRPLQTAHGLWQERTGLIVQLRDRAGHVSYGEVAPIPWFGSETLAAATAFWQGRTGWMTLEQLTVPDSLPATQFGVETALASLQSGLVGHQRLPLELDPWSICGLLPAGEKALTVWSSSGPQRHTWKWKIGVFPVAAELAWLEALAQALPETGRLRLDANGGLTVEAAATWLEMCDRLNQSPDTGLIEFLEQPLPPDQLSEMEYLSQQFQTAIALDESVATLPQLVDCHRRGWSGWVVVKPAIAGSPHQLSQFLQQTSLPVVFSSSFETVVGRQAALQLALDHYQRTLSGATFPALGFGTLNGFNDDWDAFTPEQLWHRL